MRAQHPHAAALYRSGTGSCSPQPRPSQAPRHEAQGGYRPSSPSQPHTRLPHWDPLSGHCGHPKRRLCIRRPNPITWRPGFSDSSIPITHKPNPSLFHVCFPLPLPGVCWGISSWVREAGDGLRYKNVSSFCFTGTKRQHYS